MDNTVNFCCGRGQTGKARGWSEPQQDVKYFIHEIACGGYLGSAPRRREVPNMWSFRLRRLRPLPRLE
ncbi:uncharacterized protein ARMOST_18430 [Armillaria ostoyae]|uniref:Uncharacterized protein n=1 Tax=Armillaria ostoyae TaxID=47428 RepID=A0A284S1U4_ARMOS|nr:uncharacterized protein ARMOST_18430 [Armillaria ostoyae]